MSLNLEKLLLEFPGTRERHAPGTDSYNQLKVAVRSRIEELFSSSKEDPQSFAPFGNLILPFFKMGNINSLNLFDLDELIILSFYWKNRNQYKNVLDIGANIGLHSIILSKCGFNVKAFEPDPQHFCVLKRNLELNQCESVEPMNAAVSSQEGEMEFVRVLGNTTGSHLAGSKANPYGELDRFPVKVKPITPFLEWADLIKLDAEGHEKEIILSTNVEQWKTLDALVEVENENNAQALFNFFKGSGVNLFAQKINWYRVENVKDIPVSYREGMLFISLKDEMPWD